MIHFTLPIPVFIDRQTGDISAALGIAESDIDGLLENRLVLDKKTNEQVSPENACAYLKRTEAIMYLCIERNISIKPITKVDIPLDVYCACDVDEWNDICCLASRVEFHANRFASLFKQKAPVVLLDQEALLLKRTVEDLEHNNRNGGIDRKKTPRGRVMQALNDVGYSLLNERKRCLVSPRKG